jgi:hypothetical protein
VFDHHLRDFPQGNAVEIDTPRVVISLCPKGGAGKTTVSTNLALGLAHAAPGEVVIIDLDLQFGDVSSALGLNFEHSFADAIRDFEKLDAPALKAYLTPHPTGLFVLCAPATPTEADDLTPEHVADLTDVVSRARDGGVDSALCILDAGSDEEAVGEPPAIVDRLFAQYALAAQIIFIFQPECFEILHGIAPSWKEAMRGQIPPQANKPNTSDYAEASTSILQIPPAGLVSPIPTAGALSRPYR